MSLRPCHHATSRRTSSTEDLAAEREAVLREPASPDRARKLRRISSRLYNLRYRNPQIGESR